MPLSSTAPAASPRNKPVANCCVRQQPVLPVVMPPASRLSRKRVHTRYDDAGIPPLHEAHPPRLQQCHDGTHATELDHARVGMQPQTEFALDVLQEHMGIRPCEPTRSFRFGEAEPVPGIRSGFLVSSRLEALSDRASLPSLRAW